MPSRSGNKGSIPLHGPLSNQTQTNMNKIVTEEMRKKLIEAVELLKKANEALHDAQDELSAAWGQDGELCSYEFAEDSVCDAINHVESAIDDTEWIDKD